MQVLRYMALQWKEMYAQGQTVGGKLPPIIPIVIYQGRGSWQARASFQDLVEMPSKEFKEFVPDFSFAFFNIGKVDEEKVRENVVLKFYVAIIKALDSPELRDLRLLDEACGFSVIVKALKDKRELDRINRIDKMLFWRAGSPL